MATVIAIASIASIAFGLLAGVAVIQRATEAIRAAEHAAVATATLFAEGERDPCERAIPPVVQCSMSGGTATVSIELHGSRATATAGPER
ncbi:MAG: hypothetical protein RLZZ587_556 [Actinomycetota bacterium]|jgi:hypothetical protein